MEFGELERDIDAFVDEYELYLNTDRIARIKPTIDKYISELDIVIETMGTSLSTKQTPKSSPRLNSFFSRPSS